MERAGIFVAPSSLEVNTRTWRDHCEVRGEPPRGITASRVAPRSLDEIRQDAVVYR
jgi:hypothetical protein